MSRSAELRIADVSRVIAPLMHDVCRICSRSPRVLNVHHRTRHTTCTSRGLSAESFPPKRLTVVRWY
jgi:hypothetical protein